MKEAINSLKPYLLEDEKIIHLAEDILWSYSSSYPVKDPLGLKNSAPINHGDAALTNHRLILLVYLAKTPPFKWYSVTEILSLAERPPKYQKDILGRDYPYQAELFLSSGLILIFETQKDNVDQRGKSLSRVLVSALIQLKPVNSSSFSFSKYAQQFEEHRRQQEEDRRRQDDDNSSKKINSDNSN